MGDPIAELRSPIGSIVSVYLDRPGPGGFAALITDLLKPVREKAEDLDRSVTLSVRSDTDRIHALADRLESDAAPAYAVFASSADDIFLFEPLSHSAPNIATLGPRPYLRPLRAAPREMRAGILIADRAQARTFVSSANLLDEVGEPLVADIGKSNYGGFAGYDEHVVRARAYEESARLWRSAGQRLLEVHQAKPFDYLAIGGHEESVEEVARSLHPYLERLPRESFTMDPGKITTQALRTEIETMDRDHRRQRQTALAGRVCDTAWGGGNAVLGLNRVLAAANTRAIEVLVVAGDFTRPGRVCGRCGRLSRSEQTCPVCGAITFEVDDLVAAAMDSVIESGGRVSQVSIASPLDTDGIGALTRFPVPI